MAVPPRLIVSQSDVVSLPNMMKEDLGDVDIINYGNLHNIDFIRTQTLCQGGEKCDFCFVRHRKGEAWERSKSV